MESKPFHFKHFSVAQDHCTQKVGTDSVLLGSWVNIRDSDKSLLDIGTGCGLIALMLAQRTQAGSHIDAVEIEEKDVQQAIVNVANSPWPEKITLLHTPVQKFYPPQQYDLIVSNPPYFVNSLHPPEKRRSQARHTGSLSFEDLLFSVIRLLTPAGRFALVLPHHEGAAFLDLAAGAHLFPSRRTAFRSRVHKPVERLLLELSFARNAPDENEIVLYESSENWTQEYKTLTKDFYLNG